VVWPARLAGAATEARNNAEMVRKVRRMDVRLADELRGSREFSVETCKRLIECGE